MILFLIFLPFTTVLPISATLASDISILNVRIPYEGDLFHEKRVQAYHVTLGVPKGDQFEMPIIEQSLPLNFTFGNVTVDSPHFLLNFPVLKLPQIRNECTRIELEFFDYNGEIVAKSQANCLDNDIELTNITYIIPPAKSATLSIRNFYFGDYLNNSLDFVLIPTWPRVCPPGIVGNICPVSNLRNALSVDEPDAGSYCMLSNNMIKCTDTIQPLPKSPLSAFIICLLVITFLVLSSCLVAVIYWIKKRRSIRRDLAKRFTAERIRERMKDKLRILLDDRIERDINTRLEQDRYSERESTMITAIKKSVLDCIERNMNGWIVICINDIFKRRRNNGIERRICDKVEESIYISITIRMDEMINQNTMDSCKSMNEWFAGQRNNNILGRINVKIVA